MKKAHLKTLAIALAAALATGAAGAAPTASGSGTLAVTATIANECAVGQNAELAFGTLSMLTGTAPSTTDSTGTGKIDAICTSGAPNPQFKYTSANTGGTDFRLVGTDTTTYIVYTLYESSDSTANPVTAGSYMTHPGFTADGTTKTLDVSGRISAAERSGKAVQGYTDTITITTAFGV